MFVLFFQGAQSDAASEYILTVDDSQKIEMYEPHSNSKQPVLDYRPSSSAGLSIQKALLQSADRLLWLQRNQNGLLCVRFKHDIDPDEPDSHKRFILS